MKELAKIHGLLEINIGCNGNVTDAGVKALTRLEGLRSLTLGQTQITDAGLKELAGLKKLRTLVLLNDKQVTGTGLKELAAIKSLRSLEIEGTQATEAGVSWLRHQLPNCRIDW